MAKAIQTKRLTIKQTKPRKIASPSSLLTAVERLGNVRERLMQRELRELKRIRRSPLRPKAFTSRIHRARSSETKAKAIQDLQEYQDKRETRITEKTSRIISLEEKAKHLIAPRQKQLHRIAVRDAEFPRLLNRTFFFSEMQRRVVRKGEHSLVYLDMDHLTRMNNAFGRPDGGLRLLTAYSRALANSVGARGFVGYRGKKRIAGHIGGDEFLLYLPMSAKKAAAFLEKVFKPKRTNELKKMSNYKTAKATQKKSPRNRIPMSFSAGVIEMKVGENLLRAERVASALCNRAKRRGRLTDTISFSSNIARIEKEETQAGRKTDSEHPHTKTKHLNISLTLFLA